MPGASTHLRPPAHVLPVTRPMGLHTRPDPDGREERIADQDAGRLAEIPPELLAHPERFAVTVHVAPPW